MDRALNPKYLYLEPENKRQWRKEERVREREKSRQSKIKAAPSTLLSPVFLHEDPC